MGATQGGGRLSRARAGPRAAAGGGTGRAPGDPAHGVGGRAGRPAGLAHCADGSARPAAHPLAGSAAAGHSAVHRRPGLPDPAGPRRGGSAFPRRDHPPPGRLAQRGVLGRAGYTQIVGAVKPAPLVSLGAWRWPAFAYVGGMVTLTLLLPLGVLGYQASRLPAPAAFVLIQWPYFLHSLWP